MTAVLGGCHALYELSHNLLIHSTGKKTTNHPRKEKQKLRNLPTYYRTLPERIGLPPRMTGSGSEACLMSAGVPRHMYSKVSFRTRATHLQRLPR